MSTATTIDVDTRVRTLVTDQLHHLDLYELLSLGAVLEELRRAKALWPAWPRDPVYGAAIVGEEAGELLKAVMDTVYKATPERLSYEEATHTCATALRFMSNHSTVNPQ